MSFALPYSSRMTQDYAVGVRVDGLYDGNDDDMWYPGRIQRTNPAATDGAPCTTYEVLYDDGEIEYHVAPRYLRLHIAGTICVGSRVYGRYAGGDEWYPGKVTEVQENGCYTIEYDDTEVEQNVPIAFIKESTEAVFEPVEAAAAAGEEVVQVEANAENEAISRASNEPNPTEDRSSESSAKEEPAPIAQSDVDAYVAASKGKAAEKELSLDSEPMAATQQYQQLERPRFHHPHQAATHFSTSEPDEYATIIESIELLEKRLADAASVKAILSTLVKQMRTFPQVTSDLVHERDGERLIIDVLKFHGSHAVIQCYCFVFLRRLCFLCPKSTHFFLRNGITEFVTRAMNKFVEDAILQASACGALAVFTRVHAGLSMLLEHQVAQLVLATIVYHKTYSIHTRQVHYYACEGESNGFWIPRKARCLRLHVCCCCCCSLA